MEKDDAESLLGGSVVARSQSESPPRRRERMKNRIVACLDDELVMVSPSGAVRAANARPRGATPLKNWKHEKFACLVVAGTEPEDAYVIAGFERHRANHLRLMRQPHVKDRIDVSRRERELAARAAGVPIDRVLEEMDRRGLVRIEDFFERNAAGILAVRNLETVPVEVGIAFVKALGEGFGIGQK